MSRREEVEASITEVDEFYCSCMGPDEFADLCRTLADEIDALRAEADPDAAEAARYSELHPDARYVLAEDYDRLAAENAELRTKLNESAEETRRAFNGAMKIGFEIKDIQCALSAANATLDALREVVREKRYWDDRVHDSDCMHQVHNILYPTTKENEHDDH